jgi:hypothetical protein
MRQIMDFYNIVEMVNQSILKKEDLEIYYPQTENNKEGWRKITPYSITTDIPPEGEVLVIGKDRLSPGHILNAYDGKELKSFILGKIKQTRIAKK